MFPITPAQGFNVHAQTFTPVQYHSTAPLMSQQIMPGPMPFFSKASGPPNAPMLANVTLRENGIAQGEVTAPAQAINC